MTNTNKSGVIPFLGIDLSLDALTTAFNKANDTFIEPGVEISCRQLTGIPECFHVDWQKRFKKPILTLHEGQYVFLFIPDGFESQYEEVTKDGKTKMILKAGFKARFVTKYNYNRAKYVPYVPPPAQAPVEERPYSGYSQPNNNSGFRAKPHHGGGFQNNFRRPGDRNGR